MAELPESYRRFTRVNLPVWVIVGTAVAWGIVHKLLGKLTLEWSYVVLLIALGLGSATARTWVGLKDPRVMYRMTLPLVVYDLVVITLVVRLTGGLESQLWLLYFPLLVSEAAVMSTRTLLTILALTAVGYAWASAPLSGAQWNDFWYRVAAFSLTTWLIHQVYRSHVEYRTELAELREQYDLAQERERIAQEFHDGLGHYLVSVIRGLESLMHRLRARMHPTELELLQEQVEILRGALDETRQTIQQLRTPESIDLQAFVMRTAERVAQRLGAQLHCECPPTLPNLPPLHTLMLMRVVQEALSNVMKHAGNPQNLWVTFYVRDGQLNMRIADDGKGFSTDAVVEGMGLQNMRERIHALGGELHIQSAEGQGTEVVARIPLARETSWNA
ncbi:MAG: sensor histidine kinase [Fimbriimonadales bacterium]|nr:sensor histidine kinase [Fimbriimonadales bacterium]MDW8052477.1 sensor histidine kinase [Armatimonadota bacterium]